MLSAWPAQHFMRAAFKKANTFQVEYLCCRSDLISFSGILYSIYPPLFLALLVYSIGGTGTSLFLGRKLVGLNFQQEAQEANFRLAPTLPLPSCLVPHQQTLPFACAVLAFVLRGYHTPCAAVGLASL